MDRQARSPAPGVSEVEESSDGSRLVASPTDVQVGIGDSVEAHPVTPEELLVKAQLEATVRTIVTGLPKRERALIERTYFEGQKIEQVAASMGVTRAWARRVHDRAIERIEGELRKHEGINPGGSRWKRS